MLQSCLIYFQTYAFEDIYLYGIWQGRDGDALCVVTGMLAECGIAGKRGNHSATHVGTHVSVL
jgi:hypothetical protein